MTTKFQVSGDIFLYLDLGNKNLIILKHMYEHLIPQSLV